MFLTQFLLCSTKDLDITLQRGIVVLILSDQFDLIFVFLLNMNIDYVLEFDL